MAKVSVIMEDDNGNFHQGAMNESNSIIVSGLVSVYPGGNFTVPLVEVIEKLSENIRVNK